VSGVVDRTNPPQIVVWMRTAKVMAGILIERYSALPLLLHVCYHSIFLVSPLLYGSRISFASKKLAQSLYPLDPVKDSIHVSDNGSIIVLRPSASFT
jgi:hypothetical protein